MLSLPPTASPIRGLFDLHDLADLAAPSNRAKLPTFRQAVVSARASMKADTAIRSVNMICLRATGHLWLIEFRHSGSWKKVWDFGALA